MRRIFLYFSALALFICLLGSCLGNKQGDVVILYSCNATPVQILATKEINRYIYLRTSVLSSFSASDSIPSGVKNIIFIGTFIQLTENKNLPLIISKEEGSGLKAEQYIIKNLTQNGINYLIVLGGDEFGCLYGAYRLAELLGVRFYLHGDVVPDLQTSFYLAATNIHGSPLFGLRGIQPFHDFPEGPDWWNLNEYKSVLTQLPKMGMNFFGLHTYPEGGPNAEPTVWIGLKSKIDKKGNVLKSYPSSYQSTHRGNWGYYPENTSEYHLGASLLFETDKYGPSVMDGTIPSPDSVSDCNEVFNRTGVMLQNALSFGKSIGIKTCVGTETPLVVPKRLRERLAIEHKDVLDPKVISQLYEGIFERIKRTYPVDYYWLWTPEGWTWDSVPAPVIKRTETDLLLAVKAAKDVNAPFTLATCGWVLGPPNDRKQFDKSLPKEIPFSCINRYVGFSRVEQAFAGITDRPKWAIPWMEDDPGLIYPQLWAGRMRRDAQDALKYGCTGLFGIHWRTQILGPNVSALAKASWDQGNWNSLNLNDTVRDIPVKDFYEDWALAQFGEEVSSPIAEIFTALDGSPLFRPEKKKDYEANLYRPVTWIDGPGGIKINKTGWTTIEKNYAFLDKFESLSRYVKGPGNWERYQYWINYFRYARRIAQLGCVLGELDSTIHQALKVNPSEEKRKFIVEKVLPLRIEASQIWGQLETNILASVATSGEMGTITNLEQHNLKQLKLLTRYDSLIVAISGKALPEKCSLSKEYAGPERIFIAAYRSLYEQNEDINLKIIILSKDKASRATLYWRKLGAGNYNEIKIKNVARAVYEATINYSDFKGVDIEYYISAKMPSGKTLVCPATAPEINYSAVIFPNKK